MHALGLGDICLIYRNCWSPGLIFEVGVPFSDPLADGLTTSYAQRALESKQTMTPCSDW